MNDDHDALRPLIDRLPRSVEPPGDLWPGVAARLAPRRRRPRLVALAVAAGILIAAGSSLATAWLMERNMNATVMTTIGPAGPREAAYIRTAAGLEDELDRRRAELSPQTVAVLERNLAIIDRAIRESRAALAADPGNEALVRLLWASHERKVSLLEQATRLAAPT